ncbi:TonB-dependent receptor plug domain-containing protein [Steroidobacter sp.]|uniref:TonB-dependent receptor plug domain-containing protein n=1 Tax=Steroidobacter sp. TaxID=1978227 RepID=UPI001A4CA471|nr:TonB-dependent receptor [Steroidobacter sp.]MBL8271355.1 TonB-dependent receptor [Steroidobacter sp.]
MKSTSNSLRHAVHCVLVASATVTLPVVPALAQEQDSSARPIEEVVITGSRIRRVDEETASPVFVMDQGTIANTGVQTMGDLMMRVPAISGAATNPQVNNGGGTGESNVELRGLGAQRTLVLLNGRRINVLGANGTTSAVDINMIPINMIERVEVLKEGAGAVYGSDAIAGVVNFITKKNFDGAEVNVEYGQTGESDGEHQSASLTLGSSGDKLSVIFGVNYNKQDSVSAADRDFSAAALYLYGGVITAGGSSRTNVGRIRLPAGSPQRDAFGGCSSVARNNGASGTSADTANYHCFANGDFYNYQPYNLLITPQERSNIFTMLNYKINDHVEAYGEVVYSRTTAGFNLASLPFDANADDTIISADSYYNPFGNNPYGVAPTGWAVGQGLAFGGVEGLNPNMQVRLEALGSRRSEAETESTIGNLGLRGDFGGSSWQWDVGAQLGHMGQNTNVSGYLLGPQLAQALGPSFDAGGGNIVCGTPGNVIAGCTPINIFNVEDPAQIAALQAISTNYRTDYVYESQGYALNANGELFDMPAGPVLMAVGAEYRTQRADFETDVLTRGEPPLYLSCLLAQETCTGDSHAKYNVRELYTEFFVPLLKDLPGVQSLNVTAGVRYSDYSKDSIGDDTNAQFKVEYRPISDLLVRGSYAQVFRAPTLLDLSKAPSQDSPTFNDPCTGLTPGDVAANPNLALACQGVPLDGTFSQPNSQITGLVVGSPNLKPETGDVVTFGVVYDPGFIQGLSVSVDFWKYKIKDLITALDPNFAIDQCVQTGSPEFCDLQFRYPSTSNNAGLHQVFVEPIVNLGELQTDGIDFGVKYSLRDTAAGSFNFTLDMTRINSYENTPSPGATPVEIAGTFDRQFGNYAKWRGLLGIGWAMGGFDGLVTLRYIHSLRVDGPDGGLTDEPPLEIGSMTYVDATVGYTFPTDTKIQVGGINLGDKVPPLLFQNNVTNANTDVSTYDLLGRRWYVGVTQKF